MTQDEHNKRKLKGMRFDPETKEIIFWRVSWPLPDSARRTYHDFSTLRKAQSFMSMQVSDADEDYGLRIHRTMIWRKKDKPKILDGIKYKDWLRNMGGD